MLRRILFALMATAMTLFAVPALSQTPDGETPAVETVCDPLKNATPGLYGLCVAFCESHDGDIDPETNEPRDNSVANEKILENYNRKKTAGDPDMPCLRVGCPCFDAVDLAALDDLTVCSTPGKIEGVFLSNVVPRGCNLDRALAASGPTGLRCAYQDTDPATCQILTSTSFQTTLDEFTTCRDLLLAEAALRGITCP